MNESSRILLGLAGLSIGGVLYVLYRTERGETAAVDVLEEIDVTAGRIASAASSTLQAWLRAYRERGERFRPLFDAATARYKLPADLVARVAWQESRYRDDIISGEVRSSAGAVGIMQIIPRWHPDIDPGPPELDELAALTPSIAIPHAAKYLRNLYNSWGTWALAIAAYNWGPGNLAKHRADPKKKPMPKETSDYVRDVLRDVGLA